jgi:flagellar motor switch protein FliN/FliY
VTSTTFLIGGEPCRLVQLVPSAFLLRMARALDELGNELAPAPDDSEYRESEGAVGLVDALEHITLRVWAELGRTRLPLGKALGLPRGAVVDLDHGAQAPVDLYVNGVRFAQGRLTVTDDGEWAFSLDELCSCAVTVTPSADTLPEISNQPTQGAVT